MSLYGKLDHREAVPRPGGRRVGLERRLQGRHPQHPVQTGLYPSLFGDDQVGEVGRVERPAEYPDLFHDCGSGSPVMAWSMPVASA